MIKWQVTPALDYSNEIIEALGVLTRGAVVCGLLPAVDEAVLHVDLTSLLSLCSSEDPLGHSSDFRESGPGSRSIPASTPGPRIPSGVMFPHGSVAHGISTRRLHIFPSQPFETSSSLMRREDKKSFLLPQGEISTDDPSPRDKRSPAGYAGFPKVRI